MIAPSQIIQSWQQKLLDAAAAEGRPNPLPKFGADGYGGMECRAAILAYQATRVPPLPQTGQFDAATRAALNPPPKPHISIPPAIIELGIETALDAVIPPSPAKAILMNFLPTIVQWVIAVIPGIPDDISKVRAEIEEIASSDSGVAKIRSFIAFARVMLNEAEAVVNKVDPQAAVLASTPIPAAVAALAPTP